MSIFSKLFPGGNKSEDDSSAASVDSLEKGSAMKRPPNDAKPPAAARPEPDVQKSAVAPSARVGAVRAPPPRSAESATQGQRVVAPTQVAPTQAPVARSSTTRPITPQAPERATPRADPSSGTQRAPGSSISPGSYVAVSASRLHPPVAPPAKAPDEASAHRPIAPPTRISEEMQHAPPAQAKGDETPAVAKAAPAAPAKAPIGPPDPSDASKATEPEPYRAPGGSIADTFERLLSTEIDAGFASMQQPVSGPANPPAIADLAEVRTLFAQLVANHVRAVRDFVIDLRWSDATGDWIAICSPALRSLRRAAEKLELKELCVALDDFSNELSLAQDDGVRTIVGARRSAILVRYDELTRLLPQAFALDLDRTQREAVILQSLLLQVPDVKKVILDKMYAAGLTTLEAMQLATAADIVATAGIPEPVAQRIVERFRLYREQVKATAPDATRARERQRIADLASKLRREHDAYERASASWSREAAERKKELRRARAQTLLDIRVELARLGEVERLDRIERLPFEAKVIELESFLEEARDKYAVQP
jgi:hypothetical protein